MPLVVGGPINGSMPVPPLFIEHLEIRPSEYQVLVDGRRARLTVREFQIFYELAQRQDRVVRRHELYDLIWGGPMAYRDRSVEGKVGDNGLIAEGDCVDPGAEIGCQRD